MADCVIFFLRPRLNILEAFNVITIKLVVILNHFQVIKQSFMGFFFDAFYVRTYAIFIKHGSYLVLQHSIYLSIYTVSTP